MIRMNTELGAIGHTRNNSLVLITCSHPDRERCIVIPAGGPAYCLDLTITLENGWISRLVFKRFA